jgi:GNAT superfamily N-acetyltransferase
VEHSAAQLAMRQAAAMAAVAPESSADALPFDGGALIAFGPHRYVNRAIGVGFGDSRAVAIVTALEGFYGARGMPPSVELNPWTAPSLCDVLSAHGLEPERLRNVYVRGLGRLPETGSLHVESLTPATAVRRSELLADDRADGSDARRISDEFCAATSAMPGSLHLLAFVEGVAAACGSLDTVDGVAWLGGAATAAAYRGMGLQTGLIIERLRRAEAFGCELAAATALPDGRSAANLERLGFTLLHQQQVMTRQRRGQPASN